MQPFTDAIRSQLEPHWQRAFEYVERAVGGRIVAAEVQPRWRPAYYLDVEVAGEVVPIYFRGDRGALDHCVYPLDHEMRVLKALEKHGIPVPHVYGFCEDPRGIVMARIEGRPDLSSAETPEEAQAVLDEFVDILARMHAIDVADLGEIGLPLPQTAEELGLGDFERWDRAYRSQKVRPDPFVEFMARWVRDNVPPGRSQVSLLQGDTGQFLFQEGRVTTLIDLELSYFGDPAADLAGLFARDLSEPMPSLEGAIARYEQKTGRPVDRRVVMYHGVRFGLCTPQTCAPLVADPSPDIEYIQYLAWYWVNGRAALQWIARLEGVPLEPWSSPTEAPSRHNAGHQFLNRAISALPGSDSLRTYQRDTLERAAVYLERADRYGPALEAEDLDEAAGILGHRLETWEACDAALEKVVMDEPREPDRDARIIQLLHHRCLRNEWLMKPVLRELADASYQPLSIE